MPTKRKWTQEEIEAEAANFDWSRVKNLPDNDIETAAKSDPDSYVPSDAELKEAVSARTRRLRKRTKPAAE